MSATTFVFTIDLVTTDQDGNEIARAEWNPKTTSVDGWVCPEEDCDYCLEERWHPYDQDPPECDAYGHEDPVQMVPAQVVNCYNCSETVAAADFADHVRSCHTA